MIVAACACPLSLAWAGFSNAHVVCSGLGTLDIVIVCGLARCLPQ